MIRSLRQRHRVMVIALTAVLPTVFAVGIASRREIPVYRASAAETHNPILVWTRNDLWEKRAITTRLSRVGSNPGKFAVQLVSMDQIVRPDVLVYWASGPHSVLNSLPDGAIFLGSFEQTGAVPLNLPGTATNQTGALVLYSLADQEMIATSKPFSAR